MLTESERRQQDYYNRIANTYDRHYAHPFALKYRYQVFDQLLEKQSFKNLQVLDAMCGGGENSGYFVDRDAQVTGIDISESQCQLYRKHYPNSRCICTSILRSKLPDESFDFIVTESLHHLPPLVDEGVRELTRLLRPDGILMVWEPVAGSLLDLARKAWYRLDRQYFEDNETSIDINALALSHVDQLEISRVEYGGNLAHLLVQSSMQFRIPPRFLPYYAPLLLKIDPVLQRFQGRRTACWVAALFRKRAW